MRLVTILASVDVHRSMLEDEGSLLAAVTGDAHVLIVDRHGQRLLSIRPVGWMAGDAFHGSLGNRMMEWLAEGCLLVGVAVPAQLAAGFDEQVRQRLLGMDRMAINTGHLGQVVTGKKLVTQPFVFLVTIQTDGATAGGGQD
jgi:hypothetical protein